MRIARFISLLGRRAGSRLLESAARGLAAFLGCFTLLNLAGQILRPGFDANDWWIMLPYAPPWASRLMLFVAAALLAAYAARPAMGKRRRPATLAVTTLCCLVAIGNAATYWQLRAGGALRAGRPLPLSALIAAALAVVAAGVWRNRSSGRARPSRPWLSAGVVVACMVLFPLAQMTFFGKSDYRRPADAIVVFGARAYADGTASQCLEERVRTAVGLYHDGLADTLIFSGGPGDGDVHETESMRRLAVDLGVPDESIVTDPRGLNTRATVANTAEIFRRRGVRRILAVSHFYHLPRIKLAYRRAGWEVYTVPAEEICPLTYLPHYMAREVAAIWVYYLRPLGRC